MSPNQFRRNHQSGQPDQEFKQGVQSQRRKVDAVSVAAHQRAREPGTSPKSRHEHGQNDRGQRRGHAKRRNRQPQTNEFAETAAEPRDKEKPKEPHHSLLPFPTLVSQAQFQVETRLAASLSAAETVQAPIGLRAERRNRKQ